MRALKNRIEEWAYLQPLAAELLRRGHPALLAPVLIRGEQALCKVRHAQCRLEEPRMRCLELTGYEKRAAGPTL